jgi:hypothetical protein
MLIAASVFTWNRRHILERWAREGGLPPVPGNAVDNPLTSGPAETPPGLVLESLRDDFRLLPEGQIAPACLGDPADAGGMVVVHWPSAEIAWQSSWGNLIYTPAGFCFADGFIFLNDLQGCSIFQIGVESSLGQPVARISHPYMNDLHGLERTSRGLLAASSGTDAIIEIDLQGRLLYDWWAADHGWVIGPAGIAHVAARELEHRNRFYHTRFQSTHVNTALLEDAAGRFLLALLFHQGQLIRIDRAQSADRRKPEVLLDGLARPHGLERVPGGWILASSASSELIFLDSTFRLTRRVSLHAGWLQDCTMLSNGHVLVNDVDNHSVLELAEDKVVNCWVYPADWRLDEILEVPAQYEPAFRIGGRPSKAAEQHSGETKTVGATGEPRARRRKE